MRSIAVTAILVSSTVFACGASAQATANASLISVEFTGDVALPTSKLQGVKLKRGYGGGANVQLRLQRNLQAYAGYELHKFEPDELLIAQNVDALEHGYTFGLRYSHAFMSGGQTTQFSGVPVGFWIKGGGLVNRIELQDGDGDNLTNTEYGLGWEAGAGLTLPVSRRVTFTPGARYRSLSPDLKFGSASRNVTMNYVTATLGLAIAF